MIAVRQETLKWLVVAVLATSQKAESGKHRSCFRYLVVKPGNRKAGLWPRLAEQVDGSLQPELVLPVSGQGE